MLPLSKVLEKMMASCRVMSKTNTHSSRFPVGRSCYTKPAYAVLLQLSLIYDYSMARYDMQQPAVQLTTLSVNLQEFYHECRCLIGYAVRFYSVLVSPN